MAKQLQLLENEMEIAKYRVSGIKFGVPWSGLVLHLTNQRIILVPAKPFGKKTETTINYADIESAKSTFHAATILYGQSCFTLFMKDGSKRSFGLSKTMKDGAKQMWAAVKADAASDEARKHSNSMFASAREKESRKDWEALSAKALAEAGQAGGARAARRDKIVEVVNLALAAAAAEK